MKYCLYTAKIILTVNSQRDMIITSHVSSEYYHFLVQISCGLACWCIGLKTSNSQLSIIASFTNQNNAQPLCSNL